jgi:hypothetical protein
LHDFLKSHDAAIQTDVAILYFSRAFDTVPHNKLLNKLEEYAVRSSINNWLANFLTKRKMKFVIDGEESKEATVDWSTTRNITRGPLLLLCHINDLPDAVKSSG